MRDLVPVVTDGFDPRGSVVVGRLFRRSASDEREMASGLAMPGNTSCCRLLERCGFSAAEGSVLVLGREVSEPDPSMGNLATFSLLALLAVVLGLRWPDICGFC
jgi:hypothetical protein